MTDKRCYMCGTTKPASDFYKDASRPDGLDRRCKRCHADKARRRAAGEPLSPGRKKLSLDEIKEHFHRLVKRGAPDACWEWQGLRNRDGYGRVSKNGANTSAHRFAYTVAVGEIPSGMFVCHACDNRLCCNPAHLWLGTAADNNHDRDAKGRSRYAKTLTPEQVAQARSEVAAGVTSLAELGRRFGVSAETIRAAVRGQTHRQVSEPPVLKTGGSK
jgi:hypothetical protein